MKQGRTLTPTAALALAAVLAPRPGAADASRPSDRYGQLPLRFEVNVGQTDPRVRFLARGAGYSVFLTPSEAVLTLEAHPDGGAADARAAMAEPVSADMERAVLRLRLLGARPDPALSGADALAGRSHYLRGRDPGQWRTNIPNYGSVRYEDVYDGVDMVYHGRPGELEYDFVVGPGGDPRAIRVAIEGADGIELDPEGDLVARVGRAVLRQRRPMTYQQIGDARRVIPSRYVRAGVGFGFEVGEYDRSRPLVIDPALMYSSYLGGTNVDEGHAIAVDPAGSAYVAGLAGSTNFPPPGPIQPGGTGGGADAFVLKLDPSGTGLVYATYLGGSGWDEAFGIAVDAQGAAYLAGYTNSTNFPTAGPTATVYGGGFFDGFVSKIDPSGSVLLLSRYLGGSGYDATFAVAVDAHEAPYLTGWTLSTNFPTTPAPILQAANGGARDAYVTKLDSSTFDLVYSTYLGGSAWEAGWGIAVDVDGFAYVTGDTDSTNFPVVLPALQPTFAGGGLDAFVAKLDPIGSKLAYSTYLGGSGTDTPRALVVDGGRRAYVTGFTGSPNFPVKLPVTSAFGGGSYDAFVTELSAKGTSLVYSRYLGGSGNDLGYGIALWDNMAYVTGQTSSTDFPLQSPVQAALGGTEDAFVTRLSSSGATLVFSTYLGGTDSDCGQAIAVSPRGGAAYVAGLTRSLDFPTAPGVPLQGSFGGGVRDAFVTKIIPAAADLSVVKMGPSSAFACTPMSYSIVVTNNGPDDATRVTLVDTLPAGLNPVGVSTSVGFCTAGPGNVTCDLSPLPNGASATVGLTVIPRSGALFNTATATGGEPDLDPGNNTGATFTFVWPPPWCWPFGCPPC